MTPPADLRPIAAPVFVDDTGRRRVLTRRAGRVLVIGFATYIGLMVVGFAGDPRVGPVHLPTFGLPNLGLMVPPAPPAGGEQSGRGGPEADLEVAGATAAVGSADSADTAGPAGRALPAPGGTSSGAGRTAPALVSSASGGAPLPELRSTPPPPATTTSAPTTTTTSKPGQGPEWPTTTTSSPATSTATTPPAADPGRGPGEDSGPGTGPAAAKGPDGSGAPGQIRKTTTTTAG